MLKFALINEGESSRKLLKILAGKNFTHRFNKKRPDTCVCGH